MTRPFPQPPARYAPARGPLTQPQTLRRLFPTVDNRQRVHLVESSLHLLYTSSAPPLHLHSPPPYTDDVFSLRRLCRQFGCGIVYEPS